MSCGTVVSIVVTNYNYEHYVGTAVQSALDQTHSSVEVIVVDDGSSDGSRNVIDAFGTRVRRVYQENAGQGAAINAGFSASSGELVIFLDSDDVLDKRCVEEVTRHWADGIVHISFRCRTINHMGATVQGGCDSLAIPSGDLREAISTHGGVLHMPTSGNAFSATFLRQVLPLPAERWRIWPDFYLCYLAAASGLTKHVPEVLFFYREHGRNNSNLTLSSGKISYDRLYLKKCRIRLLAFEAVVQHCVRTGLKPPAWAFHRRAYYLRDCLMLKRLDPRVSLPLEWYDGRVAEGPVGRLTLWWLLLKASATENSKSIIHRIASVTWACLFMFLPLPLAEKLYLKTVPA